MPAETHRSVAVFTDPYAVFYLYEINGFFIFCGPSEKPANRKGDGSWSIVTRERVVTF
jgi:hypothetical protein